MVATTVSALLAIQTSGCIRIHVFIGNVSGTMYITVVGTQIRPQASVYMTILLSEMLDQVIYSKNSQLL